MNLWSFEHFYDEAMVWSYYNYGRWHVKAIHWCGDPFLEFMMFDAIDLDKTKFFKQAADSSFKRTLPEIILLYALQKSSFEILRFIFEK